MLTACGEEKKASIEANRRAEPSTNAGGEALENTGSNAAPVEEISGPSPLDNLPEPMPDTGILPALDIEGGLLLVLYLGDPALFLARFDGQEPVLINERMDAINVEVSPDGRWLAYTGAGDISRNSLIVYDLETMTQVNEMRLSNNGHILGWSADSEWLAAGVQSGTNSLALVKADGSSEPQFLTTTWEAAWLNDGTMAVLHREAGNGNFVPTSILRHDPATNTTTTLEIPVEANPAHNIFDYEADLLTAGFTLAPDFIYFGMTQQLSDGTRLALRFPQDQSATAVCDTWNIEHIDPEAATVTMAYSAEDTHSVSNLTLLPDDSYLLIRWYHPDCSFGEPIVGELLHVWLDGRVELVTDTIMADEIQINLFQNNERHFTVSPNGRFVVWISHDGGLNATTLEMIDLQTGARGRLMTLSQVRLRDILQSVTWVP